MAESLLTVTGTSSAAIEAAGRWDARALRFGLPHRRVSGKPQIGH